MRFFLALAASILFNLMVVAPAAIILSGSAHQAGDALATMAAQSGLIADAPALVAGR